MARVRVHQHVNPLSPFYRQAPNPLDIHEAFGDPSLPLFVDIGCARGRFLLKLADEDRSFNYLGVEIREPLVVEANRLAAEAGLANLHYSFCNAMLWLDRLLENVPEGMLAVAVIQFPDPWFKKKHEKRRMVNPQMVETLARHLRAGGLVVVRSDVDFLFDEMAEMFRSDERFTERELAAVPFSVKSEREKAVEDKGLPIYRTNFVRN
ncbi:MAG: tRNA (guanine-N(7)-)-methyltransferase [Acidobacteria bacterium OLB17]|nr:MAG: tRNA (guanine-N(7)-)-methyltransferase [Acidobacteria bacterium OLB17]MCZ2390180.1 tRNA (guanosine(46)-N7)-methyltransferase TrmB [Acidobacteriota bacterium]